MVVGPPIQQSEGTYELTLHFDTDLVQQMYHVKEIPTAPPGGLDMNIADEEEFSPDKLRANIERLYMTIVSTSRVNYECR